MNALRPALLLTLAVAGLIALIALEVMQGMSGENAEGMLVPLASMVCIAAVPVLLLTLFSARWTFWVAFGVAALMSLFHAMHVVEHIVAADYAMTVLIIVTMLAPSAGAATLLWQQRQADTQGI